MTTLRWALVGVTVALLALLGYAGWRRGLAGGVTASSTLPPTEFIIMIAYGLETAPALVHRPEPLTGIYLVDPATGSIARWTAPEKFDEATDLTRFDLEHALWSYSLQALILPASSGTGTAFAVSRNGNVVGLSLLPGTMKELSISADGRAVAFQTGTEEGLFEQALDSRSRRRLTELTPLGAATWCPRGRELAFLYIRREVWEAKTENPQATLYRVGTDGEGLTEILDVPIDTSELQWAPVVSRIGYVAPSGDGQSMTVWFADPDRREQVKALEVPAPKGAHKHRYGVSRFAWSPNGRQMALAGNWDSSCKQEPDGTRLCTDDYLYIADSDGASVRQLTTRPQLYTYRVLWVAGRR